MDYSKLIGEKVISSQNKNGTITKVDGNGYIHVKFDGDAFDGGFMFDPFINGYLKFEKPELQKRIDDKIAEIENKLISLVNKCKTADKEKVNFTVTLDNNDGTKEVVLCLNCLEEDAFKCFGYIVSKQQKEYRNPANNIKWRVVRLFDKDGKQIAQES